MIDRLFSFLGSTIKILLIVIGALVALLIIVAVLWNPGTDDNGKTGEEQTDSLATEYRQIQEIASDVMDENDVMTGEDFTTIDAASRSNSDAALDVPFDEQSTVVFGE